MKRVRLDAAENALPFTGERFTSAVSGKIESEHLHRYFIALDLCHGKDVLDVASGEGYGSALLSQEARSVVGVDIAEDVVAHARAAYQRSNLTFRQGDACALPVKDRSVDVVVSFETIEHFADHDKFLVEIRRVLRPGGTLVISSPDRDIYSPPGCEKNPYHVRELNKPEFLAIVENQFQHCVTLNQRFICGSCIFSDRNFGGATFIVPEQHRSLKYTLSHELPRATYVVCIASDSPVVQSPPSLHIDFGDIFQRDQALQQKKSQTGIPCRRDRKAQRADRPIPSCVIRNGCRVQSSKAGIRTDVQVAFMEVNKATALLPSTPSQTHVQISTTECDQPCSVSAASTTVMVDKDIAETPEFYIPNLGLDVRPYLAADQKQGIHHIGRYQWAASVVRGRRLLDLACGAGYGSKILTDANSSLRVVGVDYASRDRICQGAPFRAQPVLQHGKCGDVDG